jgi:AraC family ethanolamine operon transcriptional activator
MARIDDFDRFRELARGWDVNTWLLEAGGFCSSLFQVVDNDRGWNFAHARLFTPVRQQGATPPGLRTFAVPDTQDVALSWRRQFVDGKSILAYPLAGEHDAVTPADYGAYVISANEHELCDQSEVMGLPEVLSAIGGKEVICCSSATMQQIRVSMGAYERAVLNGLPPSELERRRRMVIRALVTGLAAGMAGFGRVLPRLREKAVRQAEAYVRENAREAPSVEELSRYTGASIRTLQYGFRQVLGISPKAYIKATRLNCVRRALAEGDAARIRVADVANEWGFWHMGSFAADYRKLFGELPSSTLSRPKAR